MDVKLYTFLILYKSDVSFMFQLSLHLNRVETVVYENASLMAQSSTSNRVSFWSGKTLTLKTPQ